MENNETVQASSRRSTQNDVHAEQIRSLYVDQGLSAAQIAERLSISMGAVYSVMERHNIPRRSRGRTRTFNLDEATLRRLYVDEQLSLEEIATRHGTTGSTVHTRMQKLGIPTRGRGRPSSGENNTTDSSSGQ